MYQLVEVKKPKNYDNYHQALSEKIASEGTIVFQNEDKQRVVDKMADKQLENIKNQSGLHYELIEDGRPSTRFNFSNQLKA